MKRWWAGSWVAFAVALGASCQPPCANDAGCDNVVNDDGGDDDDGDDDQNADTIDALSIAPALCDFGEVAVGRTGECVVTLSNPGATDVVIPALSLLGDARIFFDGDGTSIPLVVPADGSVTIRLIARPTAAGVVRDTFVAETIDGEQLAVALRVEGVGGATCATRFVSVNGVATTDEAPVVRVDDVVEISADESQAPIGGTIVETRWTVQEAPASGDPRIGDASATTTTFSASMPGAWRLGLTIVDDLGTETACALPIDVTLPTGLLIQMTHDTAGSDVDLHLRRGDGDWCGVDDCHAENPTPDWGPASPTFSATSSETILIEDIADGRYVVGVDHVVGDTQVVVRVFFAGALQHEATLGLDDGQWLPVQLDVVGGVAAITTLDDVSPQQGACLQN